MHTVWRHSNLVPLQLTCAVDFCWTLHPLPSPPTSRPEARIRLTLFLSSVVWACFEMGSWLWHQNRVLISQDNVAWFLLQCYIRHRPPGSMYVSLFWWSYFVVRTLGAVLCVCVCRLICGTPAYVCGAVYVHHTLAVFTPLCNAVNILSWHIPTALCCFLIPGTYTLHASSIV